MAKKRKKQQKFIRNGLFSIEEVLPFISYDKYEYAYKEYTGADNKTYLIKMNSARHKCFHRHGIRCVTCGIKAKYFAMESHVHKRGEVQYFFNLYAINEAGNEVMMTKDHILPKSKGGADHIDNYQTMCIFCNTKKAHFKNGSQNIPSLNKQWSEKYIKTFDVLIGFNKIMDKWFAKQSGYKYIGTGCDSVEAVRNLFIKVNDL